VEANPRRPKNHPSDKSSSNNVSMRQSCKHSNSKQAARAKVLVGISADFYESFAAYFHHDSNVAHEWMEDIFA